MTPSTDLYTFSNMLHKENFKKIYYWPWKKKWPHFTENLWKKWKSLWDVHQTEKSNAKQGLVCILKKAVLENDANSKVNTCDRVLFLKVFSCEFYIFHKSFYRTPDASNQYLLFFTSFCRMGGALENAENRWDIGRRREARSTFKARSIPSKWLW